MDGPRNLAADFEQVARDDAKIRDRNLLHLDHLVYQLNQCISSDHDLDVAHRAAARSAKAELESLRPDLVSGRRHITRSEFGQLPAVQAAMKVLSDTNRDPVALARARAIARASAQAGQLKLVL